MSASRALLTCALVWGASPALAAPSLGSKAPPLVAGEWVNLPQGLSRFSPADLRGKTLMVEFWATW
jgi:hypothetical protein